MRVSQAAKRCARAKRREFAASTAVSTAAVGNDIPTTPTGRAASGNASFPSQGKLTLSEAKAAEALDLSARTLQRLRIDGGGPPFVIIGRKRVVYPVAELEVWLRSRLVRNTGEADALRRADKR